MNTVIVVAFGLMVVALFWLLWRRNRRPWNGPDLDNLDPEVRTILEAGRLARSDPEAAHRLMAPLIEKFEAKLAALRARAETDPTAAAELHDGIQGTIAAVVDELWKVQGRDEDETDRLTHELEKLRSELEWARQRRAI